LGGLLLPGRGGGGGGLARFRKPIEIAARPKQEAATARPRQQQRCGMHSTRVRTTTTQCFSPSFLWNFAPGCRKRPAGCRYASPTLSTAFGSNRIQSTAARHGQATRGSPSSQRRSAASSALKVRGEQSKHRIVQRESAKIVVGARSVLLECGPGNCFRTGHGGADSDARARACINK
jgi:hypothetical protein